MKIEKVQIYKVQDNIFYTEDEANKFITNQKEENVFNKIKFIAKYIYEKCETPAIIEDAIVNLIGSLKQEEINIIRRHEHKKL